MSVTWTREAAAHLVRRAGFGRTPAEIDSHARGLEGAVSYLVDYDPIGLSAYEASLSAKATTCGASAGCSSGSWTAWRPLPGLSKRE
jgi:hypothetical protein